MKEYSLLSYPLCFFCDLFLAGGGRGERACVVWFLMDLSLGGGGLFSVGI